MSITTIFIDLDGTLYSNDSGLWQAIGQRISVYMQERMGFSPEEETQIRSNYLKLYGTTLSGLQIHHKIDPEDYLAFVHNVPLEKYLSPDPILQDMLDRLPQSKWIFTNADDSHACRVMNILGVQNCFQGVIDIRALHFTCKPKQEAYEIAMKLAKVNDPSQCLFIDDTPRNLEPARQIGFETILITNNPQEIQDSKATAYQQMSSLKELLQIRPDLINHLS